MNYFHSVKALVPRVASTLEAKGIDGRFLVFGGELPRPEKNERVPTDARSEFLANRAMGDWAEEVVAKSFNSKFGNQVQAIHYGDTDSSAAGEEGFAERYLAAKEETRLYGKRPDLLLLPATENVPADISAWDRESADEIARRSLMAIEVRSSKFKALKYMAVRQQEREQSGKKPANESPSFTVKVEDLCIVYRWLEVVRIPQFYVQVFFDSLFAIDVKQIFETIASGTGFKIDKPAKSQLKATIMIPITSGTQLGTFEELPEFGVDIRETRTGRVDAFVVPKGGQVSLIEEVLRKLLNT